MSDKPHNVKYIVISFPHSGTRTLQDYLSDTRPEVIPSWRSTIGQWHFTLHPGYVTRFMDIAEREGGGRVAFIPIRNPLHVADSWERRYGDSTDKTALDMIEGWELMHETINKHPDHVELFKIEDLPRLRGHGPSPEGWDQDAMAKHPRVNDIRDWMKNTAVEQFYRQMYTAEELWWL